MPDRDLTLAGYTTTQAADLFVKYHLRPSPSVFLMPDKGGPCGCLIGAFVADRCGSVEAAMVRRRDGAYYSTVLLFGELFPELAGLDGAISTGFSSPDSDDAVDFGPLEFGPLERDAFAFARDVYHRVCPPENPPCPT